MTEFCKVEQLPSNLERKMYIPCEEVVKYLRGKKIKENLLVTFRGQEPCGNLQFIVKHREKRQIITGNGRTFPVLMSHPSPKKFNKNFPQSRRHFFDNTVSYKIK